jgi:LacI family transcriptional regulator
MVIVTRGNRMASVRRRAGESINIEVFIGGAPQLELKLVEGLLEFGRSHPDWRFALRGSGFRYSAGWLRRHRVSGMLALIDAEPVARPLRAAGVPWVHLLPRLPVAHHFVDLDNHAIGRIGAETLLSLGFSRFAFCGIGTPWGKRREAGFRERLAEAGVRCEATDIPFMTSEDWILPPRAERVIGQWVARLGPNTAVMAAQDQLANRLVDQCLQRGRRVPEDIAVLGAGNHDLLCLCSRAPISSVDTGVSTVALRGAGLLERLLLGKRSPRSILVPPAGVVVRRSTDVLAFDDALVRAAVAHIRDHAVEGIKVDDLIGAFGVSRQTLARRFARYVGHTPGQEIRMARLRRAQQMIRETRLPLTEIALACGYSDLPHMDRAFRLELGSPPGALRRDPEVGDGMGDG